MSSFIADASDRILAFGGGVYGRIIVLRSVLSCYCYRWRASR